MNKSYHVKVNKNKMVDNEMISWTTCQECEGRGKKSRRIRKKSLFRKQKGVNPVEKTEDEEIIPQPPKYYIEPCLTVVDLDYFTQLVIQYQIKKNIHT